MKNLKISGLVSILFFIGTVFVTFNTSAAFEKENISSDKVQNYWWDSTADSSVEKIENWWVGQNNLNSDSDGANTSIDYWWGNNSSAGQDIQCYWWINGSEINYCQA